MANQSAGRRSNVKQQNIRLPLIGSMTNRSSSSTTDQRFINIFPETRKVDQIESTKIFLNKRPGLTIYKDFGTGQGRGCMYFNNKFYVAIGNTLYEDAISPVSKITFSGTTGHVGMIVANSSTIGDYLFVCDGTAGWYINTSGTVTSVTHQMLYSITINTGGSGYTNGSYSCTFSGGGGTGAAATYTCSGGAVVSVVVTNVGSGYTSAPTVGFASGTSGTNATGTVILNAFPTPHYSTPTFIDGYIALAKGSDIYTCDLDAPLKWNSSNYTSAEMFPDAIRCLARQNNQVVALGATSVEFFYDAANAVGSPLTRNDSTTNQMGTASAYAVYQNEKFLLFIGQSDSGGRAVWKVEGFQPTRVSDEFVDRIIDSEANIASAYGYGLRTMGHLFYIINLPTVNRTLVFDVDEKLWHEWSTNTADAHTAFAYNHACDDGAGAVYVLHSSNGTLYKLDPTKYQDDTVAIITELITNKFDMDTLKRKFMSNIRWIGDRYAVNSIDLRWTDDDYQTWSNWKTIDLADDFPNFARMGAFRRRAFDWKHTGNYPLRGEAFEITYQEGDS